MYLRIPTLAALAVVQVLATSCGGDGGGGGGSVFSYTLGNTFEPNEGTAGAVENLAEAEPLEGSVSQSSNVDGSGVTEDSVTLSNLDESVSSLASVQIVVSGADVTLTLNVDNAEESFRGNTATFVSENGDAVSAAAVAVSFELPGNTDWAAAGIWFHIPDPSSTDEAEWHFGVFAETSNEYTQSPKALTGSATYTGTSQGYFVMRDVRDDYVFNFVEGEVVLNADFDSKSDDGAINGSIENFLDFGGNDPDAADFVIVLKEVTLTDDNFFKGEVKVRTTPHGIEYGDGNWGGQFFGEGAEGVLGTFGGSFNEDNFIDLIAPDSDLEEVSFAGAFIAEEE